MALIRALDSASHAGLLCIIVYPSMNPAVVLVYNYYGKIREGVLTEGVAVHPFRSTPPPPCECSPIPPVFLGAANRDANATSLNCSLDSE